MSESISKLAAAVLKAQSVMKGVPKSGENTYDKYHYATLEDYVAATSHALADNGLSVLTSVENAVQIDQRTTSAGKTEYAVQVKLKMILLHESGEMIETFAFGQGQDRADKAIYKAITGARKYGLASLFNLATTDDPEADESVGIDSPGKQTKRSKPKPTGRQEEQAPRGNHDEVVSVRSTLASMLLCANEAELDGWLKGNKGIIDRLPEKDREHLFTEGKKFRKVLQDKVKNAGPKPGREGTPGAEDYDPTPEFLKEDNSAQQQAFKDFVTVINEQTDLKGLKEIQDQYGNAWMEMGQLGSDLFQKCTAKAQKLRDEIGKGAKK